MDEEKMYERVHGRDCLRTQAKEGHFSSSHVTHSITVGRGGGGACTKEKLECPREV
jgi:hypothetical protein